MTKRSETLVIIAAVLVSLYAGGGIYQQWLGGSSATDTAPTPTSFEQLLAASFDGPDTDRLIFAAIFKRAASAIEYDGITKDPRLKTTNDAAMVVAKLFQYHGSADQPFGQTYASAEKILGDELFRRLGMTPDSDSKDLTPELRAAFVGLLRDAGGALDG